MNNNYKKLISKINTLEKNKSKKEEKIKELQSSLNEDNKELKRLYSFKKLKSYNHHLMKTIKN